VTILRPRSTRRRLEERVERLGVNGSHNVPSLKPIFGMSSVDSGPSKNVKDPGEVVSARERVV
jgi:hypothetical protein